VALIEINRNPTRRELQQFGGIWLPLFLAVVGGMLAYKRPESLPVALGLWSLGAMSCAVGWIVPAALRPVWIGWTISHLLLAIIFYVVITPAGVLMRLCGRDPMQRKFDRRATTYWVPHVEPEETGRYFRQF
jgi:hypothetical protein